MRRTVYRNLPVSQHARSESIREESNRGLRIKERDNNIDELAHADYVGYDGNSAYLTVLEHIGIKLGAENFPYKTESHLTHWSIVKEGAAIGVMPDFVGDEEPLVQRVSDKLPPLPMDTWIVAHRELRTSRRIRTVFDYLVNELNALIKGVGAD